MITSYLFEDDKVVVSRMTRETAASRWMDHVHRAPWLADLPAGISRGLAYAVIPPKAPFPFISGDLKRPTLVIIGDDYGPLAAGPDAFHRKTLRQFLGPAVSVAIVPGKPERAVYGRAIEAALEAKRPAVLIETQRWQLAAWLKFAERFAKVPVEVALDDVAGAA